MQQLDVDSSQTCQLLHIRLVVLAVALRVGLYLASVGHDDLVSQFLERAADPRGVGPHLDHHPTGFDRFEGPVHADPGGLESKTLEDAALAVQNTAIAVPIAEIRANCRCGNPRYIFRDGAILRPNAQIWALCQTTRSGERLASPN